MRALHSWLLLFSLFLVVAGARLWLVHDHSTPLPFWDQWDAEGAALIKPYLEGHLRVAAIFAPHNEHRLVLTRLTALALFVFNQQWDAELEMTINALLCAAIAIAIVGALWRIFPAPQHLAILLMAGLVFSLPFSWENTLAGFQSAFYFLLLFSLLALWGLCFSHPFSLRWWTGGASLVLACLAMSSGLLAAAAVMSLYGARLLAQRRRATGAEVVTALICLIVIAIGFSTRGRVPGHAALKIDSLALFFVVFGRNLAWPLTTLPWFALLMQMPLLVLASRYFVRTQMGNDDRVRPTADLLFAAGFWVWLQAAAIAYFRGSHGYGPSSRYQDLLAIGALVNFLCLAFLLSRGPRSRAVHFMGATWAVLFAWGLIDLSMTNLRWEIPQRSRSLRAGESNVRGYLASGDFEQYLARQGEFDLPYPDPLVLRSYLDDKTLRRILPANVRPPLAVEEIAVAPEEEAFIRDGFPQEWDAPPTTPAWGSFTAAGKTSKGTWSGRLLEPSSLPYLCFNVAGELGAKGLSFGVRDLNQNRTSLAHPMVDSAEFLPWRPVIVPRPSAGPLEIIANDRNRGRWFAFTAPTEMGRWSYWSQALLSRGKSIFIGGACLMFALALLSTIARDPSDSAA